MNFTENDVVVACVIMIILLIVAAFYSQPSSERLLRDAFMEPMVVNVTGLNSTDCSSLRVTSIYSDETEINRTIISSGENWCMVLFLVNVSSSRNTSYVENNSTNYYVYYEDGYRKPLNISSWHDMNYTNRKICYINEKGYYMIDDSMCK